MMNMNSDYPDFSTFEDGLCLDSDLKFRAVSAAPAIDLLAAGPRDFHKASLVTSVPGKFVLEQLPASAPSLPTRLDKNHFHANNSNFLALQQEIEKALSKQNMYEHCYEQDEKMWKCKVLVGSVMSELYVSLYWDGRDHIVEVKRVRGGAQALSLLQALQVQLGLEVTKGRERPTLRALPLPARSSSGQGVSEGDFVRAMRGVCAMSRGGFVEGQLEAARYLHALSLQDTPHLSCAQCVEEVVASLSQLLEVEDLEEVRELSLLALLSFLRLSPYRDAFARDSGTVHLLLSLLALAKEQTYLSLQRGAALSLLALAQSHALPLRGAVEQSYGSVASFCAHMEGISHSGKLNELKDTVQQLVSHLQ